MVDKKQAHFIMVASYSQRIIPMVEIRHDWTFTEIEAIYTKPFIDLMFSAQVAHRETFDPNDIQLSTLMSIKTGACPEDCSYCSQSGHHRTDLKKEPLADTHEVIAAAKRAKQAGASRFCMGGAWRSPPKKGFDRVIDMIKEVKALGLETCMTLGMLDTQQAEALKQAGLDYYNHNIDTSPEYYEKIITTRKFSDRIETLNNVRDAGIKVCCGGIMGMGETQQDRIKFLQQLSLLTPHPESVPINRLIPIPGTPLEKCPEIDDSELLRTIATARILLPYSRIRLSAGRKKISDSTQILAFMAGANSIHFGDELLTSKNASVDDDLNFLDKFGLKPTKQSKASCPA